MDVARLNFSHGAHADHETAYRLVREASDATGRAVAILADLQGPKIRLGTLRRRPGRVGDRRAGSASPSTTSSAPPSGSSTTYKDLAADVALGDRLLVDDGKLALDRGRVERPRRVLPGRRGRRGRPTTRACRCPAWRSACRRCRTRTTRTCASPCSLAVDFVALSFVRSARGRRAGARDHATRRTSRSRSSPSSRSPRRSSTSRRSSRPSTASWWPAVTSAWSCRWSRCRWCRSAPSQVARERDKPVIVATQMLESMISNSRPDPRRGLRRGQRGARRRGRGDAVRGDLGGQATRSAPSARWSGSSPPSRSTTSRVPDAAAPVPLAGRARSSARPRTSPRPSTSRRWPPSPRPATPRGGSPRCTPASRCWPSPSTPRVRSQLALSWGVETFLVPVGAAHRRHGRAGRLLAAVHRPAQGAATASSSSPAARPTPSGSTNLIRVHEVGTRLVSRLGARGSRAARPRRSWSVLDLEERETDVFVGQTPSTALQRIFGGQVAGQALIAAGRTVPAEPGGALAALLLPAARRPARGDPLLGRPDPRRAGPSPPAGWSPGSTGKGEDVAIFALTADFTAGERPVVEHSLPMPDVPGPETLPGIGRGRRRGTPRCPRAPG